MSLANKDTKWATGDASALNNSSAYTPEFGDAIADFMTQGRPESVSSLLGVPFAEAELSWEQACRAIDRQLQHFGKDDWGIVDAGLFEVILWLQAPQSTNHENMPEDLPFDKDYEAAIVLQVLAWSFKAMCWMHVLTSLVCKLAKHDAIVSNR